ncbi:hypothetical protein ACFUCT_25180 [Streptomyces parvus]|uniref:hypothetical protein n=1 Tax=Streptomyces parvus TaxID=66428 RepID=UPI00363D8F1C
MNADGMLRLLAAEPSLLPSAPDGADGKAIETRRRERHDCLRCGEPADTAAIVDLHEYGKCWLDLCYRDFIAVQNAN